MKRLIRSLKTFLFHFTSNPTYIIWVVSYLFVGLLSFSFIGSSKGTVSYYLPVTFISMGLWLAVLIGALLFIAHEGVKEFFLHRWAMIFLFSLPVVVALCGAIYPVANGMRTYYQTKQSLTTSFKPMNKEARALSFYSKDIPKDSTLVELPITGETIYLFYRLDCPYCQASIPRLLNQLSDHEKQQIVFVDLDKAVNRHAAYFHMDIEKADTGLVYQKGNKGDWETTAVRLAEGSKVAPKVNKSATSWFIYEVQKKAKE